jgi:glycosyltransferase involved in cell wall biosynthesis
MKIVYLSTSTIPSRSANSIHVMKMCQAFAKNGNEVILITPDKRINREPDVDDVFSFYGVNNCFKIQYIKFIPLKISMIIHGFLAARKAKLMKPDLIYGRDIVGCFFSSQFNVPIIFESHEPIKIKVYNLLFQMLIKKPTFEYIVVITHLLNNYYSDSYPSLSGKVVVVPDGADAITKDCKPVVLSQQRDRLQVGYLGHLYPGRGIEIILQLAIRCPFADFHVVGGNQQDIMDWKQKKGSSNNLFFHGFKSPFECEMYRLGCDILLAPYQPTIKTAKWMSPLKLFEYMAAGKAIVCSDLPVIREFLENEINALLCPPDDIGAWERAIRYLNENKDIRVHLGDKAREKFNDNYTWNLRAQKVLIFNKEKGKNI